MYICINLADDVAALTTLAIYRVIEIISLLTKRRKIKKYSFILMKYTFSCVHMNQRKYEHVNKVNIKCAFMCVKL